MGWLSSRVRSVAELIGGGHLRVLWQALRLRLYSRGEAVGLRRDLLQPLASPAAKVPLTVRPLTPRDCEALRTPDPKSTGADLYEQGSRVRVLESGLPTGYAAVDAQERLCYVQWLIGPAHSAQQRRYFHGAFPHLAPDTALLEAAYTFPSHRGLHVMSHAMAEIAQEARALGVRWVITFVGVDNIASLKGCQRAGFTPYVRRRHRWLLFHRRYTFEPLEPLAPPAVLPQPRPAAAEGLAAAAAP